MSDANRQFDLSKPSGGEVELLTPAWREFIRFCRELRHGEIERLSIQDGTPIHAETIKKKVKFNR